MRKIIGVKLEKVIISSQYREKEYLAGSNDFVLEKQSKVTNIIFFSPPPAYVIHIST
jgi:hypothetical protein